MNQLNDANARDLLERQSFGLFDNVAIESADMVPQFYQIGKIIRMRRSIGIRKVEYTNPVPKRVLTEIKPSSYF